MMRCVWCMFERRMGSCSRRGFQMRLNFWNNSCGQQPMRLPIRNRGGGVRTQENKIAFPCWTLRIAKWGEVCALFNLFAGSVPFVTRLRVRMQLCAEDTLKYHALQSTVFARTVYGPLPLSRIAPSRKMYMPTREEELSWSGNWEWPNAIGN